MKKILIASLALITFGCSSMVQKGSIDLAYSNFEDRDYEDTLQYISRAENEKQPSAELKAELTYLKAQTYEKMGDYDKAQGLYEYLKEQHSQSQYGYLASRKLEQTL